tara:strand:+ start:97 stop:792 length:696 start_codon:yes stop_codon:yes gene_type:complete
MSELLQLKKPYESTIAFYKVLLKLNCLNKDTKNIIDIGAGRGPTAKYLISKTKNINFLCVDYQKKCIKEGAKLNKSSRIKFKILDILKSVKSVQNKFDGLTAVHSLCCFKKLDVVIKNMCKIKPKWIAINSLFYRGNLDVMIHMIDYNNKDSNKYPNGDFNIFSIVKLKEIFKKNGYKVSYIKPYFPKNKIKKLENSGRGSFTMKTDLHPNTTFSGPVYLPWYFVVAKKIK